MKIEKKKKKKKPKKIKVSDSRTERSAKLSPNRLSSHYIFILLKGYFSNPLSAFKMVVSNRLLCSGCEAEQTGSLALRANVVLKHR
jgi:hypothetical protein